MGGVGILWGGPDNPLENMMWYFSCKLEDPRFLWA